MNEQALCVQLTDDARAAGDARRQLREWLAPFDCADEVEHAALVVTSELVTNAVLHAHSAPVLVASYRGGTLLLEVFDDESDPPLVRTTSEDAGGLGLRIVAALSRNWGWDPTPAGKRVWAEARC